MVKDQDIVKFTKTFFGYGNLNSDIWLIGMEEGGGNSIEEIQARLNFWKDGGQKQLEDVAQYHQKFDMGHFFADPPKNQSTWNKLIRIILAESNDDLSLPTVKEFQRAKLARNDSNNCLLELFPLPSPSINHWLYSKVSTIDWLSSREKYKRHLVEHRIATFQSLIADHQPKLVVFYGNNPEYRKSWFKIANAEFKQIEVESKPAYQAVKNNTQFFIVNHPVSTGITNEYFHQIGRLANAHS